MDEQRPGATLLEDPPRHGTPGTAHRSGNEPASSDPDTCRICRGEATPDEPLFYPCKCSGSIKYVHQDCLMEWLSHSQKKHCELCKTPFRFTKLYSPDMPSRLPFHVFVTHMAKYIFRNVVVWLRAALVASVWLGWLPYLMRSVWAFLFWISDEGFGPNSSAQDASGDSSRRGFSITGSMTCPSSPLFADPSQPTTAAGIGEYNDKLLKALFKPMSVASGQPWWVSVLRGLWGGNVALTNDTTQASANATNMFDPTNITITTVDSRPSSLLSEVSILKNLTRHPAINRTIITVLEGQIITVLVIVCFILIILVRDYVVQQQPELNMRAALAAADNDGAAGAQAAVPHAQELGEMDVDEDEEEEEDDDDDDDEEDDEHDQYNYGENMVNGDWSDMQDNHTDSANALPQDEENDQRRHNLQHRPILGLRRRTTRPNAQDALSTSAQPTGEANTGRGHSFTSGELAGNQESRRNDQGIDYTAALAGAIRDDGQQSTVTTYLRIYREAGGDRDRILRKIRDEGLEDRLRQWVRITQAMPPQSSTANPTSDPILNGHRENEDFPINSPTLDSDDVEESTAAPVTSSWNWSNLDMEESQSSESSDKGKQPAERHSASHESRMADLSWQTFGRQAGEAVGQQINDGGQATPFQSSSEFSGRPRAVSDGPQRHEAISPFANNNWAFDRRPRPPMAQAAAFDRADEWDTERSPSPPPMDSPATNFAELDQDEERDMEGFPEAHFVPDSWEDEDSADEQPAAEPQIANEDIVPPVVPPINDLRLGEPPGIVNRVADFMWGEVDAEVLEDIARENAVDIFGDDQAAPFIDNGPADDDGLGAEDELAPDVVEAAVAAGLDPEALEDQEDFEGIMELIGMRGPLAGLFQNAIFCAFLVSISIFVGIFVPYNIGRLAVWVVANPTRLIRMAISFSKFVQDFALMVFGFAIAPVFQLFEFWQRMFNVDIGGGILGRVNSEALKIAMGAFNRITGSILSEFHLITASEMKNFSAISHEALISVKADIRYLFTSAGMILEYVFSGQYLSKINALIDFVKSSAPLVLAMLQKTPAFLSDSSSWMISLNVTESTSPVNPALAAWDANDRTWAVIAGYTALSVAAGLYLGRGTPLSSSEATQDWEASIIDALNQASGVMKVILIISIEMLVFPLYCGMLLDFALLPLFENTTLKSRMLFTYNFPLTSIFVHWFVGTGYMFHFALFVAMCRKIMRKGVLYFIRDPDDPEFHPVRDVLERNVTTQLRKIMFSAFVYGALVIICLGGVVWGLSLAVPHVLPIHYSSNEPVLEFPIDLLFYNFLMPLAVRFFKPSDGLHAMYTWWFRTCARGLRLTWFLFGERQIDEEGQLAMSAENQQQLPWWQKVFLEVTPEGAVAPKTWSKFFEGGSATPSKMTADKLIVLSQKKATLVETEQLLPNGRFVRSPASDQVKITKGQPVFLAVTELNDRADGKPDLLESDIYSGAHYQLVYVPPFFRTRIFLFILFIWLFAAVTGVGFTIIPLIFGRRMFKAFIPSHIRTNDIYAFSIGIYVLGSLGYFALHARSIWNKAFEWTNMRVQRLLAQNAAQRGQQILRQAARLVYTYTMLLVVFPLLITLVVELYIMMPLHTYISSPATGLPAVTNTTRLDGLQMGHTVRVIQAWTLGILYLKLGSRALTVYGGRPAHAVRAVLRRGWLDPDVGILTRAFVIPGLTIGMVLILGPPIFVKVWLSGVVIVDPANVDASTNHVGGTAEVVGTGDASGMTGENTAGDMDGSGMFMTREQRVLAFRMAYPLTALICCSLLITRRLLRIVDGWQVRIRDEAYLMGERLHNFGGISAAKASGAWRGRTGRI